MKLVGVLIIATLVMSTLALPSVKELLISLNLLEYEEVFRAEEVTMDILVAMTEENLRSIGVRTFGQRFRILQRVRELESTSSIQVSFLGNNI